MGKIDVNSATDVQVSQSVDEILNEKDTVVESTVTEPPVSEPAKDMPDETAVVSTEKTDETPVATPDGNETPKEKLYAGKYQNEYELQAAILEEVNVLKAEKKDLIPLFAEAHKTGDWSKVEAKYKELQTQVVKKIAEEKKVTTPEETKPTDTPKTDSTETGISDQELKSILMEQSILGFADTRVAARMRDLGISIPQTQDELNALEIDYPAIFIQFTQTFQNIYRQKYEQAIDYLKAEAEVPNHNLTQKDKAKTQIGEFAKKWNVTVSPEEMDTIINDAIKSGVVLEAKSGVNQFIRDGAIFKWFMAERAADILEQIQNRADIDRKKIEQESLVKGRMQGVEDIQNNSKKALKSISTTEIPASKPSVAKPINWNDPADVKARATEKEIAERLAEALAD